MKLCGKSRYIFMWHTFCSEKCALYGSAAFHRQSFHRHLISPTIISPTVHFADSSFHRQLFRRQSFRRQSLRRQSFRRQSFHRQFTSPTVQFADSSFRRQFTSSTVISVISRTTFMVDNQFGSLIKHVMLMTMIGKPILLPIVIIFGYRDFYEIHMSN